jgi:hypothetical protein
MASYSALTALSSEILVHSFDSSGEVAGPSFCTTANERVYITARACEIELGGIGGLQAAGGL